jgi:hypothetical protein
VRRRSGRIVLAAVLLAGCSADRHAYDQSADDLAHARERWEAADLTDYNVTLVFWNVLGGTSECSVAVEDGKPRVLDDDAPMIEECAELAVVEKMFDHVEESLDGPDISYAEFDNENGHVILLRQEWGGCGGDACTEILVRLFPPGCGTGQRCPAGQ